MEKPSTCLHMKILRFFFSAFFDAQYRYFVVLQMIDAMPFPQNSEQSSSSATNREASKSPTGSQRKNSHSSDSSTSGSATNELGWLELDRRLRSVLSHPLGLPLVCAFHGRDPGKLKYLAQPSNFFLSSGTSPGPYSNILTEAVTQSPPIDPSTNKRNETGLTTCLSGCINNVLGGHFRIEAESQSAIQDPQSKQCGLVDIALIKKVKEDSRPLMIIEVGLIGADWWKNFCRGVKYVQLMSRGPLTSTNTGTPNNGKTPQGPSKKKLIGKSPLLLAVMTIDDQRQSQETSSNQSFVVKLGVFLCFWNKNGENERDTLRISLLWQSKTGTLGDGSKAFGSLLRGTCDFSSWIFKEDKDEYEYFSSNCCRVGNMVLRNYDTRVHKTTRTPEIYLSKDCEDIVGHGAKPILELFSDDGHLCDNNDSDEFWNASRERFLHVIVAPFRDGRHDATKPTSFIPIMCQLETLHEKGFVHGDIRGFNTVFDEENKQGYFIDFDFGGKPPNKLYPKGYKQLLPDGQRLPDGKSQDTILPWHDWYALGRLIFAVHEFVIPEESRDDDTKKKSDELDRHCTKLGKAWNMLDDNPTTEMKDELKRFLKQAEGCGWTVKPSRFFQAQLNNVSGSATKANVATKPCATESPPQKKNP